MRSAWLWSGSSLLVACAAPPETVAELEARVAEQVDDHTRRFAFAPAAAVAIVEDGEAVARLVDGEVEPFSGEPVTGATPVPLASATKIVTSLVALQLVDEGAVALGDRVTDHVPGLPAEWRAITIEHLLTHADGLPDGFEHPEMQRLDREASRALDAERYVAWAAALEPRFAPGEDQAYGQTGFVLLSLVIETATGQPYAEVVRERVVEPLGLTSTGFALDGAVYERDGDGARAVPLAYSGPDVATAAMVSSLDDVIALVGAVQRGEVVSEEAWATMTAPSERGSDWGLGLETYEEAGLRVAGHSGGWSVVIAFVPEGGVASVSLSNVSDRRLLDLGYDLSRTAAQWAAR